MRRWILVLLAGTAILGGAYAEEETIPIDVTPVHGVEVTDLQLAWIRTWLEGHLHPDDLEGIRVDVKNRTHPGAVVYGEARLPSRTTGTYLVTPSIRFFHENWPLWDPESKTYVDGWCIERFDRVQRIFDVDGTRKVMLLRDSMAYDEVLDVLRVVKARAIDLDGGEVDAWRTQLERLWLARRLEDGLIELRFGGPLKGIWYAGTLVDGRFKVEKQGMYIA